ncbi:MAG: hypothetical protein QOE58_1255 [Actinomycetota bacterium]|nr:hypothetical protein [Actinomycetota bacterium]
MLYVAPLAIALQLQRNGEFVTVLDGLQLVYNVALPADSGRYTAAYGLESNTAPSLPRTGGWLRNINPHELAVFHGGNHYTRYTSTALEPETLWWASITGSS